MSENENPRKFYFSKQWLLLAACLILAIGIIVSGWLDYRAIKKSSVKIGQTASSIVKSTVTQIFPPKKIVCLDPGHGGNDVGATYGKVHESDINLSVALQTKTILEKDNYKVDMTRADDSYVAKRSRAVFCNSVKADILVAIHHNSYDTDHTTDYSTALYYKDSDKLLASSLLNSVSSKLGTKNQGIASFNDSELWLANMPAALSEAFFITDKSEYADLLKSNPARLTDEATGLATGIVNYFTHPDQVQAPASSDSLILDRTDYEN